MFTRVGQRLLPLRFVRRLAVSAAALILLAGLAGGAMQPQTASAQIYGGYGGYNAYGLGYGLGYGGYNGYGLGYGSYGGYGYGQGI